MYHHTCEKKKCPKCGYESCECEHKLLDIKNGYLMLCPNCSTILNSATLSISENFVESSESESTLKNYLDDLLNKFKQDPQYELKQEFGRLLMRNIGSFTKEELFRYEELKKLLK